VTGELENIAARLRRQGRIDEAEKLEAGIREEKRGHPVPLPGNRMAWNAFLTVADCRVWTFGGPAGLDWARAERVLVGFGHLGPDDLTPDLHRSLRTCADELMAIEHEERERKRQEDEHRERRR
jgi:hypothetical protein